MNRGGVSRGRKLSFWTPGSTAGSPEMFLPPLLLLLLLPLPLLLLPLMLLLLLLMLMLLLVPGPGQLGLGAEPQVIREQDCEKQERCQRQSPFLSPL